MRKIHSIVIRIGMAVVLAVPASGFLVAQDAAVVNARTVHARLENDQVRVLESRLRPGQKEKMHSHPSCVIYVVAGGRIRNHMADGKTTEATLKTGDVIYREPVTHWSHADPPDPDGAQEISCSCDIWRLALCIENCVIYTPLLATGLGSR